MTEKNGNGEKLSRAALKVGIFGAVALGAAVSGYVLSRQGRRFVKDVWEERQRTPLEDRVLDVLAADRKVGGRPIEVLELEPGVIALIGRVRSIEERRHACNILAAVKGITELEDQLEVRPRRKYRV